MKPEILKSKIQMCIAAIACCAWIALAPYTAFAQADIHFSQFYETSILRNPALTGVFAEDYKFGVYYRNQWSSISNPFQTGLISAETHVPVGRQKVDFVSFGVLGYGDEAGSIDQKITAVYPAINYNKLLSDEHNTFLSVGFTGGYVQYSFDPGKATFNNQYQNGHFNANNPSLENLPNPKMTMYDLGAGVNLNTTAGNQNNITYIIGFSGYHFTQPKFSYYQKSQLTENIRWNGNLGMGGSLSENVSLTAQANYAKQGTYSEIMVGALVSWAAGKQYGEETMVLSGGVYYRYADAIIPVVKVKYKQMAIGVSYDVNVSSLKEASRMEGGYEVTVFITGRYPDKNGISRKTVCPRF